MNGFRTGGIERLVAGLRNYRKGWFKKVRSELTVGFSADYALTIHEDLAMPHKTGQAKFLETAIREAEPAISRRVRDMMGAGRTLEDALQAEGLRILSRARELVPVDTGFLRDSGYVQVSTG